MPIHDWARVEAGVFHDFHHAWIEDLKRSLNAAVLPDDYYAMAEQKVGGFGPDLLTPKVDPPAGGAPAAEAGGAVMDPPKTRFAATAGGIGQRKSSTLTVRHAPDDNVVAVLEVMSPGNKDSDRRLRAVVNKACRLLDRGVHRGHAAVCTG